MVAAAPGEDAEVAALTHQFGALLADAPALCYSFVVSRLKGCTPAEATGFLTAAYHELRQEHEQAGRDHAYLANLEAGTFHHNVAERVLLQSGQRFQRVLPMDYGRLHSRKKSTFVVYGKLNIAGFNLCAGKKSTWIPKCRANGFGGLAPIEGEVNHDYHAVIVHGNRIPCGRNRKRKYGSRARAVVPRCGDLPRARTGSSNLRVFREGVHEAADQRDARHGLDVQDEGADERR